MLAHKSKECFDLNFLWKIFVAGRFHLPWSMAMELVQVLTQDVESPGARATLEIMMDESGVPNRNLRWSALDEHAMLVLQAFLAMYMFRPISVFAVSCCIRYNAAFRYLANEPFCSLMGQKSILLCVKRCR